MTLSALDAFRRAPEALAPPYDAPPPRLLSRPEAPTTLGYTRRAMYLPEEGRIALFSYSSATEANWLFLIEAASGECERYDVPNSERGAHGSALGADGNIYTVTHQQHLHRFLVKERRWETLPVEVPAGECAWDAIGAPNGCIYFGTYPGAYFGEYNIATGELYLIPEIGPQGKYVVDIQPQPDGRIRCKSVGGEKHRHYFDPRTRAVESHKIEGEPPGFGAITTNPVEDALPPVALPAGNERIVTVSLPGGGRFAIASPSTRIFAVNARGQAREIAQGPAGPQSWRMVALDDRSFCALSGTGLFLRYEVDTGRMLARQLPNSSPDANNYFYFETPSPRWAVGGHYSQQNVFRVEQETGAWETSPTMIARVTGEPCTSVSLNGKVYLGIYVEGLVMVCDPEQPFAYGVNPRELFQIGGVQYRPRGAATDGRHVFIASYASFCNLGGALSVYDTWTERHRVFFDVIPAQNLDAIAFDTDTGLLFGGTFRWGDCMSCPPACETAVVYAWDPASGRVARQAAPWPEADMIQVRAVLPTGVVVAVNGGEVALLDARSLEVLWRGPFPLGHLTAVTMDGEGRVYGMASGTLFRWDTRDNSLHPLAHVPGGRYLGIPVPGRFLIAADTAIYRWDAPNGTASTAG